MRLIVSDTGPLLHLYEAASLNLLEHAGTMTIPTAVDHEMVQHVREWHTHAPHWITVTPVHAPYALQAMEWQQSGLLEAGEAEAIASPASSVLHGYAPMMPRRGSLQRL